MPAIEIDTGHWPLVRIRFPSEPASNVEVQQYLAELSEIGARGRPYAMVTDLRPMRAPPTAPQRLMFGEWIEGNIRQLERVAVGNAIIANSPMSRRVAQSAYGNWRGPVPYALFRGQRAADNWCRARIQKIAQGRRLRRVPTTPPPQCAGDMAAIIDLFSEPAFLVAPSGELVFANRAANEVFPAPRPWLRDAVSRAEAQDADPDIPLQIARVSVDGRDLNLVVVGEGAAFVDLPPRLMLIARLISEGKTDKDIAVHTGLAEASVRTYVRRLYARTNVRNRAELVRMWFLRPRAPLSR